MTRTDAIRQPLVSFHDQQHWYSSHQDRRPVLGVCSINQGNVRGDESDGMQRDPWFGHLRPRCARGNQLLVQLGKATELILSVGSKQCRDSLLARTWLVVVQCVNDALDCDSIGALVSPGEGGKDQQSKDDPLHSRTMPQALVSFQSGCLEPGRDNMEPVPAPEGHCRRALRWGLRGPSGRAVWRTSSVW